MKPARRLSAAAASVFNRTFFIIFITLFFLIAVVGMIVISICGELGGDPLPYYRVIARYLLVLLCFAVIAAALLRCCRFLQDSKRKRLDDRRFFYRAVTLSAAGILVIQLVFAFCLRMEPVTDVASVERYATEIARTGSFDCIREGLDSYYIVAYQNNVTYMLLMTGIYKLTYLMTGTFTRVPVIIINTIALNLSILLTVLTARRLFGERKAFFTLILCALFAPYFSYTAYCYTDSLSLPFVIGAVYCFIGAVQSTARKKKTAALLLCGVLCFIGFEIKGSAAILLPAILIYLLLHFGIKRAAKHALPILLSFVLLTASFSIALKASDIIPEELSDRYQYPLTHWVMMGLNGVGGYERADSAYTESFPSKQEKIEANLEVIKSRLSEQGVFGSLWHIGFKTVWTWMDGTYYIGYYLADHQYDTILHDFILYDGRYRFIYFAACSGLQLFLILMMAYGALDACRRRSTDPTMFLRIAVFGLWLFLLIWETNSRYPFNFSPLYLLLATEGAACAINRRKARAAG